MSISAEQRGLFHCWCREIARHNTEHGAPISEEGVKQLIKRYLGNVIKAKLGKFEDVIIMPTEKYKSTDAELTESDHRHDFISMNGLITAMEAWAATDLNLVLVPDPEFYEALAKENTQ